MIRYALTGLAGALLGRGMDRASARVHLTDEREARMVSLAERQVRLGWVSLSVAVASLGVALVVGLT